MEVTAFTEQVADLRVRYQLTFMSDSLLVWVQPAVGAAQGSFSALSICMPRKLPNEALPPATSIIASSASAEASSRLFAQKLANRARIAVYASIQLPDDIALLEERIFTRVLSELQSRNLIAVAVP